MSSNDGNNDRGKTMMRINTTMTKAAIMTKKTIGHNNDNDKKCNNEKSSSTGDEYNKNKNDLDKTMTVTTVTTTLTGVFSFPPAL